MREQVAEALKREELLEAAREVYKEVTADYMEQETDPARLRQLVNIIVEWGRGSRALHELHRRGLGFSNHEVTAANPKPIRPAVQKRGEAMPIFKQ